MKNALGHAGCRVSEKIALLFQEELKLGIHVLFHGCLKARTIIF
jgi:hypothetical protein